MQNDLTVYNTDCIHHTVAAVEYQYQTVLSGEFLHTLTFIHCGVLRGYWVLLGSKPTSLAADQEPST